MGVHPVESSDLRSLIVQFQTLGFLSFSSHSFLSAIFRELASNCRGDLVTCLFSRAPSRAAGPVVSQALSPVLMVLVAISGSLILIGLSAAVALYVCRRPPAADLKHQMQASGPVRGCGANGSGGSGPEGRMVLIVRSPSGATGPVITSGAPSPEDTDPDIIPSKHGESSRP